MLLLATGAKGHSNAETAQRLFLSEATVKTHVGHLLAKLEVRDRVQAVIFAYEKLGRCRRQPPSPARLDPHLSRCVMNPGDRRSR